MIAKKALVLTAIALLISCLTNSLFAADANITQLSTASTDDSSYAASLAVGMQVAGSSDYVNTATTGDSLVVTGFITPDPQHQGTIGSIYVVFSIGSEWYTIDSKGNFESWHELLPLVPLQENVELSAGMEIPLFDGYLDNPGSHNVYIGYGTAENVLIYSLVPMSFQISNLTAEDYFAEHIESQIVQTRCIACHVQGGLARESALNFQRSHIASALNNFETIEALAVDETAGADYILTKISGGLSHGGGAQLPIGSDLYNIFAEFLTLVTNSSSANSADDFFSGVSMLDAQSTLRRAAILVAGRAPTQQEIDTVADGDDETLRGVLRNLMQGDSFHHFLLEGTNDRLLTEGTQNPVVITFQPNYPRVRNNSTNYQRSMLGYEPLDLPFTDDGSDNWWFWRTFEEANRRSLGELVNHIVKNELPYTEMLTADYIMLNPRMNQMLEGSAQFEDENDMSEFQPGTITYYFNTDESLDTAFDEISNSTYVREILSEPVNLPLAGVLTHPGFLRRYPTTATNRNRARSRWTFLHFLDIDIEKSTQRPTDPEALADTNNPTMNNPVCTSCHETMDPVAGAFQNWNEDGIYRHRGKDSLDGNYKFPPNGEYSPYQHGDLWYRDMRDPGLFDEKIEDHDRSLQELAQKIIREPAFARATVKFWWSSVMKSPVLLPPAVVEDQDYQARLLAYQAQSVAVQKFADAFTASNFNLKDLLTDMMMSPWFRANTYSSAENSNALLVAEIGREKLLTPENLQRKTKALTGHNWRSSMQPGDLDMREGFSDQYKLYYGGIDSLATTERSRELTALMMAVAETHAYESACPIVIKEFALPDEDRLLFDGISRDVTPQSGEQEIRQKLVDLHQRLLGKTYTTDSAEIDIAYQLFLDSWTDAVSNDTNNSLTDSLYCNPRFDFNFLDGLDFDGPSHIEVVHETGWTYYEFNWAGAQSLINSMTDDPHSTLSSWRVVMIYLLTHYHYLYE